MDTTVTPPHDVYDVVVIGGGPAGLSGATLLARSRRSVLVVDSGAPRNSPADGVHVLLGHDGIPPRELLARGRDEVRGYGGHLMAGDVTAVSRDHDAFAVTAAAETPVVVRARRLLVTTGLVDELPNVPGVRERWGHDVVHCPYCHGWEVRDRAIGVLATNPRSAHQALLFRQLSDDVMFFSHTAAPGDEQAEQMAARGIRIVEGEVETLEIAGGRLAAVRLRNGSRVARQVVVVSPWMVARAAFLSDLGIRATEHESGLGLSIPTDAAGRTDVAGVWAAGNVTDLAAQVGASASAGAWAAAQINADLVFEEARQAVELHRSAGAATG